MTEAQTTWKLFQFLATDGSLKPAEWNVVAIRCDIEET